MVVDERSRTATATTSEARTNERDREMKIELLKRCEQHNNDQLVEKMKIDARSRAEE